MLRQEIRKIFHVPVGLRELAGMLQAVYNQGDHMADVKVYVPRPGLEEVHVSSPKGLIMFRPTSAGWDADPDVSMDEDGDARTIPEQTDALIDLLTDAVRIDPVLARRLKSIQRALEEVTLGAVAAQLRGIFHRWTVSASGISWGTDGEVVLVSPQKATTLILRWDGDGWVLLEGPETVMGLRPITLWMSNLVDHPDL